MAKHMLSNFPDLRGTVLRWLSATTATAAVWFAILNFSDAMYPLAIVEAALGVLSITIFVRTFRGELPFWQRVLIPGSVALVVLFATYEKNAPDRIYLWALVIPVYFYFLFGKTIGFYVSLALLLVQGSIIFYLSSDFAFYAWLTLENFALAYVGIWCIIHIYEKERERAESILCELAVRDPLTGLYNRLAFMNHFTQHYRKAKQCSLVLVDLDGFKQINDTHGHEAGDEVLKAFSEILQTSVEAAPVFQITRESLFRVGGEEFTLLLPVDGATAFALTEDLRRQVAASPVTVNEQHIAYSFSAGVCEWNGQDDLSGLLRCADAKLYEAKNQGRNCIVM